MALCHANYPSQVFLGHECDTTQSTRRDFIVGAVRPTTGCTTGVAMVRSLFRATRILAPLSLALLAGCEQLRESCDGRGPPIEATIEGSDAQQRAAWAIDCDAHEIMNRVSSVPAASTDVTALHNRTRELANRALEVVHAGNIESSRLPLSTAHQQMYEVAAEAERASGSPTFVAWATNPWERLRPLDRPLDTETATLSTALMPGEQRALALNVRSTATTDSRYWIQVDAGGLRADAVQIYQVNWTGNDRSDWAAAELEFLGDASSTREGSILPGVTRQIWLQIRPDVAAAAGRFSGEVSLGVNGGEIAEISLDIRIFKTRFVRPTMHFGGWDYSFGDNDALRDTNRSQFIEHLQTRYVDTPWQQRSTSRILHWDNLDANGNATTPFDTSAMERWLSQWPNARRFRVYLKVADDIAGIPVTDSRFTHAVASWAQAWATVIRGLDKSPEQFDLLLVDEPQTNEQFRTTETWAKAIRQSGAGFRIWTDLVSLNPVAIPNGVFDAVDTVAVYLGLAELHDAAAHQSWARTYAERGKALEIYAFDGPARRLDPYTYYRLTPWRAFFIGATAVSFWSFADTGASPSDNEFAADGINYSPLFVSDEVVRSGKHMEAAAEGIQDTLYLDMLKQVARSHADDTTRLRAQQLLDEGAAFVYGSPQSSNAEWRSQGAARGADEYRERIGDFLDSVAH
jgi:hypothetical protein